MLQCGSLYKSSQEIAFLREGPFPTIFNHRAFAKALRLLCCQLLWNSLTSAPVSSAALSNPTGDRVGSECGGGDRWVQPIHLFQHGYPHLRSHRGQSQSVGRGGWIKPLSLGGGREPWGRGQVEFSPPLQQNDQDLTDSNHSSRFWPKPGLVVPMHSDSISVSGSSVPETSLIIPPFPSPCCSSYIWL